MQHGKIYLSQSTRNSKKILFKIHKKQTSRRKDPKMNFCCFAVWCVLYLWCIISLACCYHLVSPSVMVDESWERFYMGATLCIAIFLLCPLNRLLFIDAEFCGQSTATEFSNPVFLRNFLLRWSSIHNIFL